MARKKRSFFPWNSLRITAKFTVAFSSLFLILLAQTAVAYGSLTIVWDANKIILQNAEIQRLMMSMDRNWETVRRLQYNFFVQSPILGGDQTYNLYALPSGGKISEVIRDGATLKQRILSSSAGVPLQALDADMATVLMSVSQYATTYEEATALEIQLTAQETGLLSQLDQKAAELLLYLQSDSPCSAVTSTYYELRLAEKSYGVAQNYAVALQAVEPAARLRQAIETCWLRSETKTLALTALDDYERISREIYIIGSQIQEKINLLDAISESIDPNLVKLRVSVDTEVRRAAMQIEQTRRLALTLLGVAVFLSLITIGVIALVLHHSITRRVIQLTHVTDKFKQGDLSVRASVESLDEIGGMAGAFNDLADTIERRIMEIENLHEKLREQAIRDSLTGLFNRRYLDETLPRELATAARNGITNTLVMIDIDRFKDLNDEYGHVVGDEILVGLGAILKSQSRNGDLACRYGGDEFLVFLLGASLEDGVKSAEKWRRIFSQVFLPSINKPVQPTISVGIVECRNGESLTDLLARVDAALYQAKKTGRNRVATQL